MNKLKKIWYYILYKLGIYDSVHIAKKIGVKCGADCRFLDNPFVIFGTEPYLVSIGNHVEVTNGCRFITHDGSMWCLRNIKEKYKTIDYLRPISIGDNVFIGMSTLILPGVQIGDNCIIGAGSVVTKNIPSNSVVAGVPAKVIKTVEQFESKAQTEFSFPTKGMNPRMKYNYIKQHRAEWIKGEK